MINLKDLEPFYVSKKYNVQKHNKVKEYGRFKNISELGLYIQNKIGKNISYKVTNVVSTSPAPKVEIEIEVPGYGTYTHQGASKKEAANQFARSFKI